MTVSSRQNNRCTALDQTDFVVIDQHQLDAFIDAVGGPTAVPETATVLTDDEYTRGTVKFNLITFDEDDSYGIATQLHDPFDANDTVRDLRTDAPASFSEVLVGLL